MMAFNNVGAQTWIAPGQSHYWWFTRNNGQDFGTQYGAPDIKTPDANLRVTDQTKEITHEGSVVYHCSIINVGSMWALYNLQGGGLT
jgi:hypothetical protein